MSGHSKWANIKHKKEKTDAQNPKSEKTRQYLAVYLPMVVFGLLLGYEALLICWHAPLLWGEHDRWYWHTGLMHPRWVEPSVVWGWLPVHVCMLGLALVGVRTLYRLKKNKL